MKSIEFSVDLFVGLVVFVNVVVVELGTCKSRGCWVVKFGILPDTVLV